jgi:myosin heavy subunit
LRRAQAAGLLSNHYRMQINRHKYNRARNGTVKMQATFRGLTTRRMLVAVKIQTFRRMFKLRKHYRMLKSASIALQCATRVKIAKKELKGFQGEQKDIGKLKENNDVLKKEMQSLKAMLAAQAKEGASNAAHEKELEAKQQEIDKLEKRVAKLEKQLTAEKQIIEKLEADLEVQKQMARQSIVAPGSPGRKSMTPIPQPSAADVDTSKLQMPNLPKNYVSPEVVAKHKKQIAQLEVELKAERNQQREADGEIIKLRAAINGVQLNKAEVDALLVEKQEAAPKKAEVRYVPCYDSRSILVPSKSLLLEQLLFVHACLCACLLEIVCTIHMHLSVLNFGVAHCCILDFLSLLLLRLL